MLVKLFLFDQYTFSPFYLSLVTLLPCSAAAGAEAEVPRGKPWRWRRLPPRGTGAGDLAQECRTLLQNAPDLPRSLNIRAQYKDDIKKYKINRYIVEGTLR